MIDALLLKPAKASEIIGCGAKSLYGLNRDGLIRIVQTGRNHLVDSLSVKAFMSLPDTRRSEALRAAGPKRVFKPRSMSLCYFIGADHGPVKIGNSVNPAKRLEAFQTAHPYGLNILATCEGGLKREKAYRRQFAAHRLHGEWFQRHPDILTEIERLNA